MHEPTYRQALKEAWQLVYKNTSLWLLGLLSVLFAGSFGMGNFLAQLMVTMSTDARGVWFARLYLPTLPHPDLSVIIGLIWLIGIMLVVAIAVIFVSVTAKTALLIAMADYYKNKTIPKLGKIWNSGLRYFWKILTVEILRKVALAVIGLVFGVIWYVLPSDISQWSFLLDTIMLIFAVFLSWIISAVSIYASGYTVIDGKSLISAYKRGWQMLHEHLLVSLEISLVLTILDMLLIVFFAVIFSFAFFPALFIWLFAGAVGNAALALFGAMFGMVVLLFIIALFGAFYNTFYTSVWMYLFMKMHHEGIISRIIHHVGKFFNR